MNNNYLQADWIDTQEMLQLFRISHSTLKRWRKEQIVQYSKLGGKIYYNKTLLLETLRLTLRQCRQPGSGDAAEGIGNIE